ncbi:hypothetical protein LM599_03320 [Candidatus Acetothermia bacterium]|nr:hypothetical protein [Candidatus Acetothermia bacterium]MCI2426949.1 hypothetical protein [Candidatus Acetothermia bacterium]
MYGTRLASWYRERVELLPADYDRRDRTAVLEAVEAGKGRIPSGVLYEKTPRPIFAAHYQKEIGKRPLAELPLIGETEIAARLDQFRR